MKITQTINPKALAIAVMLAFAPAAWALPTGGAVSAGGATIATNGGTTTIGQATQNVAINWQAFNIAAGEAVRFVQPSSSSVALNRVLGADPSSILGSLSANGKVFLINPNGILFGQGAQVNVGGLVASTLNVTDADFMAGTYRFSGTSVAGVVNRGSINADGGYVALLGANVSNEGVILARLGTVALASGSAMTLDMAGDGLLSVAISQGAANALVQNSGTIRADGGQVLLTAQAAGGLLQGVVNNTGVIQAQAIDARNGTIRLLGDMDTGVVNAGGTLDASAPNGGNGGFIETSAAHVNIASTAQITTLAPMGTTGTFLIDPQDFRIGLLATDNISGATLSGLLVNNSVSISTNIAADTSVPGTTFTRNANIVRPGEFGDIFVNDAVSWNGAAAPGASTTLTLTALRDVNINQAITAVSGNLVVCCGRDVNVRAAITTTRGSVSLTGGNDVNLFAGSALSVTNGNINMCAGHDVIVNSQVTLVNSALTSAEGLGLPTGLTLSSGNAGTGPGVASGTVTINPLFPIAVTRSAAEPLDIFINYNPTSYATPTDYSTVASFTLVVGGGINLTQRMLVYPGGADKTFDGTNAAIFTALQGAPAGVNLVAGPGSSATFDTATAGVNKPITFSGFTLGGANAANFALPVACCGPAVTRTLGNIAPAVVVVPPVIVVAATDLLPLIENELPLVQNESESEFPRGTPGLSLGLLGRGVNMPPVLLAVAPPVIPQEVEVVPPAPVGVTPLVAPPVYVPPVRLRKPDRN